MAKIDRSRKIESIRSMTNGMVLLEKNYHPSTWEGLLNVVDMNSEKFEVNYVADTPSPVVSPSGNAIWREDQLKAFNFKRLDKIAKDLDIDTSSMSNCESIKNAILEKQDKAKA